MRLGYGPMPRPQIPVIPLANLALLVLTVVMISGMYSAPRGPGLRFASIDRDGVLDETTAVRVEVLSENEMVVDGEPATLAGLAEAVGARLDGREDAVVILEIAPWATYEAMVDRLRHDRGTAGSSTYRDAVAAAEGESMKGLRPLLRLDDKVAAEGRRLQNLGAGPSRWGGLTLLVAAAILHGLMLMLPAVRVKATLPAASPAPDFPRVWRFDPPAPPATRSRASGAGAKLPRSQRRTASSSLLRVPAPGTPPAPPARARTLSTEPVPEPAPDVTMRLIASEVQAHIPYPDAPPPPMEPGPSFGAAASPRDDGAPRVVARTRPVYPVAARSVSAEGKVTLQVFVLPDGRVDRASVLDCSRPGVGFEAAAVQAVKRWRYEPAPQATSARSATVTIDFKKEDGRP